MKIAEIGVWKNPMDPDAHAAAEAMDYAKGQLALADELDIPCCVNIAGTAGAAGWDAADRSNYTAETYDRIVAQIREILDDVQPMRAFYCIEPMPWMVPDGPDEYLQLLRNIEREFTTGNSIYPSDTPARLLEFLTRRQHINRAIGRSRPTV